VQYRDQPEFLNTVCKGYKSESLLAKIAAQLSHYPQFTEKDSLLYTKNCGNEEVLCLPHIKFKGDSIIAQIIDGAHKALGHFGAQRTADYIHRKYWWPKLGWEVDKFCQTCLSGHQTNKSITPRAFAQPTNPKETMGIGRHGFCGTFPTE
jgi:hypothetical protein